jgi:hypothetical protein
MASSWILVAAANSIANAFRRYVLGGHLDRVGLGPVAAGFTPYDQPHTSRSRVAQRHRRSGRGFHRNLSGSPELLEPDGKAFPVGVILSSPR